MLAYYGHFDDNDMQVHLAFTLQDTSMPTNKDSSKPAEWYYSHKGQDVVGPCSSGQLRQLAAGGQLKPDDLVGKNRVVRLVKASTVKGLFATS